MDECGDDVGVFQIAVKRIIVYRTEGGTSTHKLSWGPKTLVGMAEVKLQPNSSL